VFAHAFGTIDKLYLLLSFHLQSVGNVQVGIGHSFQLKATGWKWKLTTCFGGDGISRIRNKTSLGLFPGMDLRFAWRADYVLPELTG
jgi:hypothetical protein